MNVYQTKVWVESDRLFFRIANSSKKGKKKKEKKINSGFKLQKESHFPRRPSTPLTHAHTHAHTEKPCKINVWVSVRFDTQITIYVAALCHGRLINRSQRGHGQRASAIQRCPFIAGPIQ